jgi:hypothetical protein
VYLWTLILSDGLPKDGKTVISPPHIECEKLVKAFYLFSHVTKITTQSTGKVVPVLNEVPHHENVLETRKG